MYVGPTIKEGLQVTWAGSGSTGWTISTADGIEVNHADGYGLFVGRGDYGGVLVYEAGSSSAVGGSGPLGTGFQANRVEGCGLYVGRSDEEGVYINSTGSDGVAVVEPDSSGLYVSIAGVHGVYVDSSLDDGIRVEGPGDDGVDVKRSDGDGFYAYDSGLYGLNVTDTGSHGVYVTGAGSDGVYISSPGDDGVSVAYTNDDGIYVYEAGGRGGYFDINATSTDWAVYAHSTGLTGKGIYCYGNGTITGAWSKAVSTSKGWETVQSLSAPDEEIVASGTARLVSGSCRVRYERLYSEAISRHIPVKVVLTPVDQWSGLYVTDRSPEGFTVLTGAGAEDVEFTWQAIGRRKGYEERPVIAIPDPDEENARLAAEAAQEAQEAGALKEEERSSSHRRLRSRRAEDDAGKHGEIRRVSPEAAAGTRR